MASADPSDPFYPLAFSTPFSSSSQPLRGNARIIKAGKLPAQNFGTTYMINGNIWQRLMDRKPGRPKKKPRLPWSPCLAGRKQINCAPLWESSSLQPCSFLAFQLLLKTQTDQNRIAGAGWFLTKAQQPTRLKVSERLITIAPAPTS